MGVFGYSDEDGTEAQRLPDKVDPDEIAARVAQTQELVDLIAAERAADRIGERAHVLVERAGGTEIVGRAEFQGPEDGGCRWAPGESVPRRGSSWQSVESWDSDGVDV